jgi:hypothetical protein
VEAPSAGKNRIAASLDCLRDYSQKWLEHRQKREKAAGGGKLAVHFLLCDTEYSFALRET